MQPASGGRPAHASRRRSRTSSRTRTRPSSRIAWPGSASRSPSSGRWIPAVRRHVERAVEDSGSGSPVRVRALKVPIEGTRIESLLDGELAQYRAAGLEELGGELARELVDGGETPAWDALTPLIVEEKSGSFRGPVDGVVIARTVKAQQGETALFLKGFYRGLAEMDVPTIGVEPSTRERIRGPHLERGGALDGRRHRGSGGKARARAAPLGNLDRELRAQGCRR